MKILTTIFTCTALMIATATAQQPAAAKSARTQKSAAKSSAGPEQAANVSRSTQISPIVIRGGKLLTISHGVIENGTIVLENGKITAVGAAGQVSVPANAKVIDAAGMTVYPGLIDSNTQLGLTEISADQMTNDLVETSDE